MKKICLLMLGIFFSAIGIQAQKRNLTPNDFDHWQDVRSARISDNGRFVLYQLEPGMGNSKLVITDLKLKITDTIPRGYKAQFSGDGSYVSFAIEVPIEIRRKEETKKSSHNKNERDSLGIFLLKERRLIKYPDNIRFNLFKENSSWMVYKTMVGMVQKKKQDIMANGTKETLTAEKKKTNQTKKDTLLIAMNPIHGDSIVFKGIKDYRIADKGGVLLMSSVVKDSLGKRTHLLRFRTGSGIVDTLMTREGEVRGINMNEMGTKLTFLQSSDTTKIKTYKLYAGSLDKVIEVESSKISNKPRAWIISENASPYFSDDGTKVYFGTAYPKQEKVIDTLLNNEREKLDIWAWTDKRLQPMQLIEKSRDENRAYKAVYHMDQQKAVQLADSTLSEITVYNHGNARYAMGTDDDKYLRAQSWNALKINDFYLIDTQTGERTLIAEGQNDIDMGPNQKYALMYDRTDSIYYSIDLKNGKRKPLTVGLGIVFYDELNDSPSEPLPYGIAGWAKGDTYVLVYDRYDIWKLDPTGKEAPLNLTQNGRETKTVYRYQRLNQDVDYIDLNREVLLNAFNEVNKQNGFATTCFNRTRKPRLINMGDHVVKTVAKADDDNHILFTKERFNLYPDLYISTLDFKNPVKISNAGSQMDKFQWGTNQLVSWKGYNGVELQGVLYLPENMDKNKKYPMVTHFYERLSNNLHRFSSPSPSRSEINKSFYVSNDYIVFVPDIVYRDGEPGQSAYDCIVSGVEAMVKQFDCIDSKRIALQGQSWGGYQTAYLITQTDRFAAAMAGAPVGNMTSAYGGIRWDSGQSRMFQYEHTQSRMGGTLWDKREDYIKNSPVFFADKVNTPLLIMHNDEDGAVPWYQGIEYFMSLRRLDKPVWMLNYNGQPHNLRESSWGNRKDLSIRMMQFFDYYLKGKEAPQWMKNGRPAVQKDYSKAY